MTNTENKIKEITENEILNHTVNIVSAYFNNYNVDINDIKQIINTVYHEISNITYKSRMIQNATRLQPAVPIEDSVHRDYLICLEDGKKLQMLKRHLRNSYGMTVDQYKERWNLPHNYPSVCESYSLKRKEIAVNTKLGVHNNHWLMRKAKQNGE